MRFTGSIRVDQELSSPGTGTNAEKYGEAAAAAGVESLAVGKNASVSPGDRSIAIGYNANVSDNDSVAIGRGASCASAADVAIGTGTSVSAGGIHGVAIGNSASVTAIDAFAMGFAASATHTRGIAIGRSAVTTAVDRATIGTIGGSSDVELQIGKGFAAFGGTPPVSQPVKINDPSGGATIDAEARTAINAIIDVLEGAGLAAAV